MFGLERDMFGPQGNPCPRIRTKKLWRKSRGAGQVDARAENDGRGGDVDLGGGVFSQVVDAKLTAKAFMTISGGLSQNLLSMFNTSSSATSKPSKMRQVGGGAAEGASPMTARRRTQRASVMAHYTVGQKLKRCVPCSRALALFPPPLPRRRLRLAEWQCDTQAVPVHGAWPSAGRQHPSGRRGFPDGEQTADVRVKPH